MRRLLTHFAGAAGISPCAVSGRNTRRALVAALGLALVLGCGSGDDVTAPEDGGDDNPPAGQLPDALVGNWRWEEIGDVLCDPVTGQCTSSYARSQTLRLTENGDFQHVLVFESNLSGCSLEVLHESNGTAEAEGTALVLHIAEGTTRVDDTCGESGVTDESGQADRYTWEITEGEGGAPELVLVDEEENTLGPFRPEE